MRVRKQVGFIYTDDQGRKVTVSRLDQVPPKTAFVEQLEWFDLGVMKFVLEMKYTYEEMVKIGRYPKPGSQEEAEWHNHKVYKGKRMRLDPNPNGEYLFCHYIETPDGQFKDMSDDMMDRIRSIIFTASTETEEEYVARKIKARTDLAIAEQEAQALAMSDAIDNSRISAEKRFSRGKIIYGT